MKPVATAECHLMRKQDKTWGVDMYFERKGSKQILVQDAPWELANMFEVGDKVDITFKKE